MARINNRALFFTTSPRTPAKMVPEIQLLYEQFDGQRWDAASQVNFMDKLAETDFFEGTGSSTDKAFSARDRMTRAPKSLGFVDLQPSISLTEAGREFVYGKRPHEVFLRQLIKYQLPSPYHVENPHIAGTFWIRPYLEIFRLIRQMEYLTFEEFKIFAVQLTDYRKFAVVEQVIRDFRKRKEECQVGYNRFVDEEWTNAIRAIYHDDISTGTTRTRETQDASLKKFIRTKKSNFRDYADACFRYLRFTGFVSISSKGRSISIFREKLVEIDYILEHVERNPVFTDDEVSYKNHLFHCSQPVLYVDNKDNIIDVLMRSHALTKRELRGKSVEELKDLRDHLIQQKKVAILESQVEQLKSYSLYSEIIDTFNEISSDELYDAPLIFEWNTWRAMTMLDGGSIKGNFKVDDLGDPMSTAQGNMPDIECDYGDFMLSVEVTLQSGQRQYEAEGEPVARHYGQMRKHSGKESYCIFVAPIINPASLAHFFAINQMEIAYYGGKSQIIPLALSQFMRLVENSYIYDGHPMPHDVKKFLSSAIDQLAHSNNEIEWSQHIQSCVENWLLA